ncbi:hypothetical protein BJX61DRAFT_505016 [Aspergillus egyptiacus]|nr:hypothetical protein BJX61DRAFT_505016 [Aspergillus egyptiacus]
MHWFKLVRFLVESGTPADMTTLEGYTALDMFWVDRYGIIPCPRISEGGHLASIRYLVDQGSYISHVPRRPFDLHGRRFFHGHVS